MEWVQRPLVVCVIVVGAFAAISCSDPEVAKRKYAASGKAYFQQKKYPEAIIEYRNALRFDPRFAEARYGLAEAYDRNADAVHAYREYILAADLMPENVDAQLKAGMFLLAGERYLDAKDRAQKVLKTNPKSIDALLLLGQATAGLQDLDGAVTQIEKALAIDPSQSQTYASLGQVRLAQGNAAQAEQAFKQAVTLNPQSPFAALALGNFYFSVRRTEGAGDWFRKAVGLDAKNVPANRALAAYYLATNRLTEAEAPLKVVAYDSPLPQGRLVLADYYYAMRRLEESAKILHDLQNDASVFADVRLRLAVLEFSNGQSEAAYKALDEVLARDRKHPLASVLKGRFLLTESKVDAALPLLRAAIEGEAKSIGAHYWLGTAYRMQGKLNDAASEFATVLELAPRDVPTMAQLAETRLRQGNIEAAIALAEQATAAQPDYPLARIVLVRALLAAGDVHRADVESSVVARRFPDLADGIVAAGLVAMAKRDFEGAGRAFQRALEAAPNSTDVLSGLIAANIGKGKAGEAMTAVEAQLARRPDDPALLHLAAKVYDAQGNQTKREETLRRVIAADPSNLPAYVDLAHLYLAKRNMEEARRQYEAVVERDPKNSGIMTVTALMLQVQGKRAEAVQRYEKVLAGDPNAAVAANNLAMLYAEDGRNLDVALQLAQTATQRMPNTPEVNDTLGWIYYLKGLPSLAVPPLQVSVRRGPSNPIYHYHLGLAYAKMGDKAKARAALGEALRLQPQFEGASEARKLLASL